MIRKILVPTDGSDHARKAVEYASDLALKYNAEVFLIHVVNEPKVPEEIVQFMRNEHVEESPSSVYLQMVAKKIMGAAEKKVREKGVREVQSLVVEGDPAEGIIEFAQKSGIDMIVMGSRGLGKLESLFLGSVSNKVCHLADCTCVTVK